jgi:hypothetical protein
MPARSSSDPALGTRRCGGSSRPIAFKVSYRLTAAARATLTIQPVLPGRIVKSCCVAPTRANRKNHRCTRVSTLRGAITRSSRAGPDSFIFTGRIGGKRLGPGSYRLVATPTANGRTGTGQRVQFQIVR